MKKFFAFILIVSSGISLWVGGNFFYDLNNYFHFTRSAPAELDGWRVVEMKPGKFSVEVCYQFFIGGRKILGSYHFPKPVYENPYLAEDLIKEWQERPWQVWYDPKTPTMATLQKTFPIKNGIYFALSLSVILYFAFLKIYVRRNSFSESSEKME